MTPPTTTRRLLTTILLIMMLTTSLAHPKSCANETDREAVSINQSIQVFQRRQNGDVEFFLDWNDYKVGFGDIEDEFWIGNDVLHLLTNDRAMQLRVDLLSFDNETAYAEYSSFSVSDESDYYRLEVGGYQGTAGDSMVRHNNGSAFSTRDEDHDNHSLNCATVHHGAWWYRFCGYSGFSNLNGRYYIDGDSSGENDGITWRQWKGLSVSMKKTEMKVRPL